MAVPSIERQDLADVGREVEALDGPSGHCWPLATRIPP